MDGITFTAKKNQWTYIIGPSGCGKSTLIDIACGLLQPKTGSVYFNSISLSNIQDKEIHKLIHVLFQESTLLPWRTVIGNLKIINELKHDKINRKTHYVDILKQLEAVDMVAYRDYYPLQLSGGMKQKIMIARALLSKAEYLLLDEPLSAVDYITRRKLCLYLEQLVVEKQLTILNVSHDIQEALRFADRIIILGEKPSRVIKVIEIETERILRDTDNMDIGRMHEYILNLINSEGKIY